MAAPVCGTDGLTYWNECLAKLAKVEIKKIGYCEGGWPAHAEWFFGGVLATARLHLSPANSACSICCQSQGLQCAACRLTVPKTHTAGGSGAQQVNRSAGTAGTAGQLQEAGHMLWQLPLAAGTADPVCVSAQLHIPACPACTAHKPSRTPHMRASTGGAAASCMTAPALPQLHT